MAKERDGEMYELVCKDRFDKMETLQQEAISLLRGSNGDPGILDDLRAIKRAHRMIGGAVIFLSATIAVQFVEAIWSWISRVL